MESQLGSRKPYPRLNPDRIHLVYQPSSFRLQDLLLGLQKVLCRREREELKKKLFKSFALKTCEVPSSGECQ